MITKENYEKLKVQFGHVASWAVWAEEGETPTSNVGDMSVLADPDLSKLGTRFVFVGLNASELENKNENYWFSFHSTNSNAKDYKLRHALRDTPYWGSYITDIIKEYKMTKSANVRSYLRENPQVLEKNIDIFREEMALLGETPVLVAMGNDPYDVLCKHLADEYTICKITHYSYAIGPDAYKDHVQSVLKEY